MYRVGFTYLNNLGNCGTSEANKKEVPRFFVSLNKQNNKTVLGRANKKKEIEMRKFITLIALIVLAAGLHAQKDVTKFLGIPVDGTKSEMIQKLKAKGFTYNQKYDLLEGEFNGEKVLITVQTNNNKVWRIAVIEKQNRDEAQIRIRFNNLLSQFENNSKYASYQSNAMIEENENISYGITVEKKQYQAVFFQKQADGSINGKNIVWFTINDISYDEYSITLFYENGNNQANGDDL